MSFPIQVSFSPVPAPDDPSKYILAEQAGFEELDSFLYYDLCRGMVAGNIPRRVEPVGGGAGDEGVDNCRRNI